MELAPDFGGTMLTLIEFDFALEDLAATAQDAVMNAETTTDINKIVRIVRICMEAPPDHTLRIFTHRDFFAHFIWMLFGSRRFKISHGYE